MYTDDKIMNGGEITDTGKFTNGSGHPFYLFLQPKSDDNAGSYCLNVKISRSDSYKQYPFMVNTWNPVVLNGVDVTSGDLEKYRIFYGEES